MLVPEGHALARRAETLRIENLMHEMKEVPSPNHFTS